MTPEQLAEHVRSVVDAAPPISDTRRARIETLLRGSEHDTGAGSPDEHHTTPGQAPGGRTGSRRPAA